MSTTNCVILARISSDKQDRELSLPAQTTRLKEYAARRQMEILREFVLIESSTVGDRRQFLECIKFCIKNRAPLLIDCVDRAQRSFMEIPLLEKYRKSGELEIHFARENIVINAKSSATDILFWHQSVMMAEAYSLHFKENVARSVRAKVAKGEFPGMAPLGYKNVRDAAGLADIVLDDRESGAVRQLFQTFAAGDTSLKSLVRLAYDLGLRGRTGKPLPKSYIHRTLQNPFYYGVARWGQYTFEHRHPRLVDRTTWDKCQDVLSGRNTHRATRWGSKDYLYRGLITDAYSGRVVTTERKKNKYTYLMTWDESGRHLAVNEDIVTGQIYKILQRMQVPPETVSAVSDYLKSAKEIESEFHARALSEIQRNITTAKTRHDNLLNLYLDGRIDDATYNAKKADLTNELSALYESEKTHRAADVGVNDTIVDFFRAAQNVADNFIKSSEVESRRAMLKSIFRTLQLKGKTLCYELNFPFNVLEQNTENNNWRRRRDSNP